MALAAVTANYSCVNSPQETTALNELEAKAYLVEKYEPGICFGMPSPLPPAYTIKKVISQNSDLVKYIKAKLNLSNDYDIYEKIVQFRNITLTKSISGYDFSLLDGGCCTITSYKGKVKIEEQKITDEITDHTADNVPC
jgi:hypothetical protein